MRQAIRQKKEKSTDTEVTIRQMKNQHPTDTEASNQTDERGINRH